MVGCEYLKRTNYVRDSINNNIYNRKTKKMYKKPTFNKTSIAVNTAVEGEPIESKVERITQNKEPIKDGAPLIYTERKDGVLPEYDIRTDRFEVAVDAMDKVARDKTAKREARHKKKDEKERGEVEKSPATPEP